MDGGAFDKSFRSSDYVMLLSIVPVDSSEVPWNAASYRLVTTILDETLMFWSFH